MLRQICKNRELFSDLQSKNYKFITARKEVIQSRELGIVHFCLPSKKITLLNIAYTPKYNSSLISFEQLYESVILYHDHPDSRILKQEQSTIRLAVRPKTFFILKTVFEDKTMLVQRRGRLTYLLSSNLQIRLWYYCFSHPSNVRVVQAFKLVDEIDLGEISGLANELYSSNFESNNDLDTDVNNMLALINKITKVVEELYKTCIESKHTRIIKSKKMTPMIRRL